METMLTALAAALPLAALVALMVAPPAWARVGRHAARRTRGTVGGW